MSRHESRSTLTSFRKMHDGELIGQSYLQHLTDDDLRILASSQSPGTRPATPDQLRSDPGRIEELLGHPATLSAVFAPDTEPGALFPASPFLVFSAAVQATQRDLASATYVAEWLGPRHRAPVFDVDGLREFLSSPWRRLFLTELLASYTRVSSGSFAVPTRRGMRRQRFSELDPVRLAGLLEVVAEAERPGIYRRLGDLALFLTGVFPDHTASHGLSAIEEGRLLRASKMRPQRPASNAIPGFGDASSVELLEHLGRRWYHLAYRLLPVPVPAGMRVLGELDERFGHARRILNVLTDRHLFPFRSQWFGISTS